MIHARSISVLARCLVIAAVLLLWPLTILAGQSDETKPAAPDATKKQEAPVDQRKREQQFTEMLTGVVLEGTWQVAHGEELGGRAPLSDARSDRYTIDAVRKVSGDLWIVGARVEYMDKDVTLPVPVRVIWAGDTPVITLDSMDLPGLGRYSARVMFHRGYYSGVWHGDNYGGVLSGQIIKGGQDQKQKPKKATGNSDDR